MIVYDRNQSEILKQNMKAENHMQSDSDPIATQKRKWQYKLDSRFSFIGEVESVTISEYVKIRSNFGEHTGELNHKKRYVFSSRGNLIEESEYNSSGLRIKNVFNSYDSAGNLIEATEYNHSGDSIWKTLYKYDSMGNMIEEARYNSDGSLGWKQLLRYNSAGNVIKTTHYFDGKLYEECLYRYNPEGVRIYAEHNMINVAKSIILYDSNGNEIESAWFDYYDPMGHKSYSKYDLNGNLIERQDYHYPTCYENTIFNYDTAGNISIKRVSPLENFSKDELSTIRQYQYDSAGNKILEAEYNIDRSLRKKTLWKYDSDSILLSYWTIDECGCICQKTDYIYDDFGNKIEEIYFEGNQLWPTKKLTYRFTFHTYPPIKKRKKDPAPHRLNWSNYIPLYGNIDSVIVRSYEAEGQHDNVIIKDMLGCCKYCFNDFGHVAEKTTYDLDGEKVNTETYKYRGSDTVPLSENATTSGSIKKYDLAGNVIEETIYSPEGKIFWRSSYKYDSDGNMIEQTIYDSAFEISYKYIHKYDRRGNIIETTTYRRYRMAVVGYVKYEIIYRD